MDFRGWVPPEVKIGIVVIAILVVALAASWIGMRIYIDSL